MHCFDLENENGFFCLYHFLLSSYIYCRKNNIILHLKDVPFKFSYNKGWDDFFQFNEYMVKYNPDNNNTKVWFGHMKEPSEKYTLNDYKLYSNEIYKFNPDINFPNVIPDGQSYNSLFIRGGDKLLYESKDYPISDYISLLLSLQLQTKNLFVHSDDNLKVEEIKKYVHDNKLNLRIFNITNSKSNGGAVIMKRLRYGNCSSITSIEEMNNNEKKEHTMMMLHAIEIMRKSQNVILSFDSNVSRFMKITFDCNVYSIHHNNDISFNIPTINPAYAF